MAIALPETWRWLLTPVSRRRALGVGGAALAWTALARPARGQPASRDVAEPRIIRARVLNAPDVWAYQGTSVGSILRVRRGEDVAVRLVNELPEPTAVHWHGVHLPSAMDGVPGLTQSSIAPGASFDYRFTPPDAGTFWYHPPLDSSPPLDRGLAGLLVVEEAKPVEVDADAALLLSDWYLSQRLVDDIHVLPNERLRLRLINATYARVLTIRIARHETVVMAIDGLPSDPFTTRGGRITLGPGNRADLFIDATLPPGESAPVVVESGGTEFTVARLTYGGHKPARAQPRPAPAPLPPSSLPARIDLTRALKHEIVLDGASPGQPIVYGPPRFTVRRGRGVLLGFSNRTAAAQVVHVHGHHFRLLDRLDDGWKPFWLDTLLIPAGEADHVAFVADNPGKWRIHAHALGQTRSAGAHWFDVT